MRPRALHLLALAPLTTAILVGCGSGRGAAPSTALRWSDRSPAWSPNGKLIVFLSDRPAHKQWDLYVIDADGSHLRRLTDDRLREDNPVFQSNRTIAFAVRGKRYVIQADGRGRRRIVKHNRTRREWLVVSRRSDGFDNIYVMRPDGSAKRRVASGVVPSTIAGFYAAWSPDRQMFAFDGVINDGSQIYLVRASRGNATQVSHDPGVCCPSWLSSGKELAWVGDGVTIARADGAHARRVAGTRQLGVSGVTSLKNGRRLLLTGDSGAYVVNSDGTGLHRLLTNPDPVLVLSPARTSAAFEVPGGPDKCLEPAGVVCFPRYSRIDVVSISSGHVLELTQKWSRARPAG